MNAQVIHQTKSPLAIDWLIGLHLERQQRVEALHALAHDISAKYGEAPGGHRGFVVLHWLVGGFAPLSDDEAAPEGWLRSESWGGFIPDVDTAEGRLWQTRVDDLPSMKDEIDSVALGIPNSITVQHEGGDPIQFNPTFHLSPQQDTVFVTWPERQLLGAVNEVIALLDPEGKVGWSEMSRSAWYSVVELGEAIAELEKQQGL